MKAANMSIKSRVEDANMLFGFKRYEGAFLNILIAVAATSRKENPSRTIKDGDCFIQFLEKRWQGSMSVEYRGELYTVQRLFYKWFRCELVHESRLPMDIEFIDSQELSVRAGGHPEYVLKVSYGWYHWLLNSVVNADCNKDEFFVQTA